MLKNSGMAINSGRVLLLGAGGAGRSAAKMLKDGGAEVDIYDRHFAKAEGVASEFGVNAISVTVRYNNKRDGYRHAQNRGAFARG